jgi:hypothetical protein
MRRIVVAILSAVCLVSSLHLSAQTPIALPYTMTTVGGATPMAATAGTQCPGLPTGVVSTDALGDGCLAVNGIFGNDWESGVAVDSFGNVFLNDDIKGVLHVINPSSGIMTAAAGGGTACSNKIDSSGDGCVAATATPVTPVEDARGVGIDPYGNILLAGYNDHFVHIICLASLRQWSANAIGCGSDPGGRWQHGPGGGLRVLRGFGWRVGSRSRQHTSLYNGAIVLRI